MNDHVKNYSAVGGIAVPLAIVLDYFVLRDLPPEVRAAINAVVGIGVTRGVHAFRPHIDALLIRLLNIIKGVFVVLAFISPFFLTACATTDCNQIYSTARTWRAVALATGAAGAAGGLSSIPVESKDARTGLAIGAASAAILAGSFGYLASSYSDEHAGFCMEPTRTSTAATP